MKKIRVVLATIFPVLVLVFVMMANQDRTPYVKNILGSFSPTAKLLFGFIMGVGLVEIGRLNYTDKALRCSIYAMILSSIDIFIIYSFIEGALELFNYILFGMIIGSVLDIVLFRGLKLKQQ